jgi:SAM-dependent methyltransferase
MESNSKVDAINNENTKLLFNTRAKIHRNLNSVLDASTSKKSIHGNILRDYFSKRIVLATLSPNRRDKIIDFGCGVGRLSQFLAKRVEYIYAYDVSEEMIKVAKQINRNSNIEYHYSETLDITSIKFNKVLIWWVTAHMSDDILIKTLKNIYNNIDEKGCVYLFEQTQKKTRFNGDVHVQRSIKHYIGVFNESGFETKVTKNVLRYPSYAMSFWQKYYFLGKVILPILFLLEKITCNYKQNNVEYYTTAFVLKKANI